MYSATVYLSLNLLLVVILGWRDRQPGTAFEMCLKEHSLRGAFKTVTGISHLYSVCVCVCVCVSDRERERDTINPQPVYQRAEVCHSLP